MPQLDKSGPENMGPKTGRKLGKCKNKEESDYELGKGLGLKKHSDKECVGKGKRLKSGKIFNNDKNI